MNIELLRSFVAVVDAGGFKKAEQQINRPQSTISRHIQKLEGDVGKLLIERDPSTVRLTEYGRCYLPFAKRMLELDNDSRAALTEKSKATRVRVGIPGDFFEPQFARFLRNYADKIDFQLEVFSSPSQELTDRLLDGKLDLAIIKECRYPPSGYYYYWQENLHWVAKARANLHHERPVPLICSPAGCTYRAKAIKTLEVAQLPWRIVYESHTWLDIKASIENGLGIALLGNTKDLNGFEFLTDSQGFPNVEPSYVVIRSRQTPPTGAVATFANKLIEIVPRYRSVQNVDCVVAASVTA
jgi:DNA-binding transcriptional LysR family regulator